MTAAQALGLAALASATFTALTMITTHFLSSLINPKEPTR